MTRMATTTIAVLFVVSGCTLHKPLQLAKERKSTGKVVGYVDAIPPEGDAEREARHRKIAERRKQPTLVMVHRGASKFAPENTLEAYAAAMDYGADGVEIDIRRSADGVLYLFHDDTLDRMTEGEGKVAGRTYYALLQFPFKNTDAAFRDTRIPTLDALLVLARQRAMLVHLDVKEAGLQEDMIAMFDKANIWDHIVSINKGNAEKLLERPGLQLYGYKGWVEEAGDLNNPEVVKRFLARPAKMIFCREDPRTALRILGRDQTHNPVPLPDGIRKEWSPKSVARQNEIRWMEASNLPWIASRRLLQP